MPLSDAQIERYSRQILLPEIGGRGQERVLAARVALAGAGPATVAAATLLGRAGIGELDIADALELPELSPDCRVTRHRRLDDAPSPDLIVDLSNAADAARARGRTLLLGTLGGTRASLLTLVGRPCIGCVPRALVHRPDATDAGPLASSAALALGALAATEALRVLLFAPARGRRTTADFATGAFETRELEPAPACPSCGSDA